MYKDKDLLPWIFGGVAIATLAIAMTVGLSNRTAPRQSPAPGTIAHMLPEVAAMTAPPAVVTAPLDGTTAQPDTTTATAPSMAAAQIQPVTAQMAPNSRIWECTINGQKIFSDN